MARRTVRAATGRPTISGCRRWRSSRTPVRTGACGWDRSSCSRRTMRRAGTSVILNALFIVNFGWFDMISVVGSRLSSGPLSLTDLEAIEVGVGGTPPNANRPARSNPVNMPMRSNPQSIHDTGLYIGSLCKSFSASPPKPCANPPPICFACSRLRQFRALAAHAQLRSHGLRSVDQHRRLAAARGPGGCDARVARPPVARLHR